MFGLLKKIFSSEPTPSNVTEFTPVPKGGDEDLVQLVKYVVVRMVDEPEAVVVKGAPSEKGFQITIKCSQTDIGKIIGKSGKNIQALRALVGGAGGKSGRKVGVEIED